MKKQHVAAVSFTLFLLFISLHLHAQGCSFTMQVQLQRNGGGYHQGQKVCFTSKSDGKTYFAMSNSQGKVNIALPCNEMFDLSISNHTDIKTVQSGDGGSMEMALSYSSDMIQKHEMMAMSEEEKAQVDKTASALPETVYISNNTPLQTPTVSFHFVLLSFHLNNLENGPLAYEEVTFIGTRRNKRFIARTDAKGNLQVYLPKGDNYTINFKYNKNYDSVEMKYTKGKATSSLSYAYIGTIEYERRKKVEEERLAAEKKRIEEAQKRFEEECRLRKIRQEEAYRLELKRRQEEQIRIAAAAKKAGVSPQTYLNQIKKRTELYGTNDTVVAAVLNRNKWPNKLLVCDITCSMQPYSFQLSVWYQLYMACEKNMQFVFFNEGTSIPVELRKDGEGGGVYYFKGQTVAELNNYLAQLAAIGCSGDTPENNMEALIKGCKMAKPYEHIVMVADNLAPVRDIALLSQVTQPVHIILCGSYSNEVLTDYLKIAWKTKGSVHTIEEDITRLAKMSEGQEISIRGITYRIMGGEFVRITKV